MKLDEIIKRLLDLADNEDITAIMYEKIVRKNASEKAGINESVNNANALREAARILEKLEHDNVSMDGCKYCKDGEPIALDMCNDGIVIESDGRAHMLSGGYWEMEIQFCPKCGRKLHD